MKKLKAIISICLAVMALTLTACGAAATASEENLMLAETAADGIAMEKSALEAGYNGGTESYAAGIAESYDGEGNTGTEVTDPDRKLIKNVSLEIETKEYETILSSVQQKILAFGGYIENSTLSSPGLKDTYNQSRYASITARVPSDQLDEFVNGVSAEGNITYKSENVTDVTLQYTDTESRKKSLLLEQDRLNELMKKAETVEDLIAIESRLSEVRYEIDSIESQLRTYDNQVDYSTVYININEVVEYTPQKEAGLWERITKGFSSCIHGLVEFFEGLLVVVIAYSPVIILIAAVVVAVVLIVKRHRRKKEEKKKEPEG